MGFRKLIYTDFDLIPSQVFNNDKAKSCKAAKQKNVSDLIQSFFAKFLIVDYIHFCFIQQFSKNHFFIILYPISD